MNEGGIILAEEAVAVLHSQGYEERGGARH